MDKWFNVNEDARIWSGHSDSAHKQGWIYAPAAIRAIDEYQGSYEFVDWKVVGDGRGDFSASISYPQLWIRIADVTAEPYEPPNDVPDPVPGPGPAPVAGDAELGAALRTLVSFLSSYFR